MACCMARTPKVVEDRREQIIDAAMRVFSQKGFTRATNKDIAREAGITPGLIYHYFENKEGLLKAVIEERSPLKVFRSLPSRVMALPPEAFLRLLLKQVLDVVEGEQFVQLIRVFVPEVIHNPEMVPMALPMFHEVLSFLEDYWRAKMESGELRRTDPALPPQVLLSCVMGFVLRRQIVHDPSALQYTHEQIADAIIGTMLKGVLPH
jgi:TetR/AcrR family transcriptional regulator, cholesterol catabolism regulator